MNRREILKCFGIGTAVIPIIGGAPQFAAESKLIEVPNVEPVMRQDQMLPTHLLDESFVSRKPVKIQMIVEYEDGHAEIFKADSLITEISYSSKEWTVKGKQTTLVQYR